ncbi:Hsp70 escorting 2 [Chlorella sorokiniana]|uniref:Hsp70 escorting 2 n=1 Tax=Chlorella sorokiniana TaxID=3076 RepID=A0A2P6TEP8_CHLSO|nr:Hsp70 escorting 2 [Chlorella sorokiniana]|eukprot:PRW21116.1 Hsp70 escorting 2 [Chlorella sorokiniana]
MQGVSLVARPCSWAAAAPPPLPAARPAGAQAVRGGPCAAFLSVPRQHPAVLQDSGCVSHASWRPQQPPRRRRLARPAAGPGSGSGSGAGGEGPAAQPLVLSSGEDLLPAPSSSDDATSAAPALSSASGSSGSYDSAGGSDGEAEGDGTVRIDLQLPRRSLLVKFTCNLCGGRSERLVNPVAWNKGMVIAQCQHCQAWHKLADAGNLVEEIRYADLEDGDS